MAVTTLGIKNRNVASTATFMDRYLTYYVRSLNTVLPEAATHYIRFSDPNDALILLGAQASVHNAAAGITTLTFEVLNSTATMFSSGAVSLKSHNQEIVNATISSTNYVLAAGEVGIIKIVTSNNENVFDLSVLLKVRPYVGRETRTL